MTTRSKQWYTKTSRLANSLRKVSIGPPLRRTCLEQQDHRIEGRWKSRDAAWRALAGTGCEVKDFRELKVWQKANELALAVNNVTASFPRGGLYGSTTLMRCAGPWIAATLANGGGRMVAASLSRFCP